MPFDLLIVPLIVLALAASRATHLVADDDLPFGYLADRMAESESQVLRWLAEGMTCTFCVSIHAGFWAALAAGLLGFYTAPAGALGVLAFFVVWFAISQTILLVEGLLDFLWGAAR